MLTHLKLSACAKWLVLSLLAAFTIGCSGSKVISTKSTSPSHEVLNNLLVIEGFQDYDFKYADDVSQKFDEFLSRDLSERGMSNVVVPLMAEFEPKKIDTKKSLKALGFQNVMTLRFYQYFHMGGDIEARLWSEDGTKEVWVGRFRWEKKGSLFESQQERSRSLANLIVEGLAKDGLIPTTKTPFTTEMAAQNAELKNKVVRVQLARTNQTADGALSVPERSYLAKLRSKIKGNVMLPQGVEENMSGVYRVTQAKNGDVLAVKTQRSSGNNRLDAAVIAGIWKSSPLPLPEGKAPDSILDITYVP